MFIFDVHFEWYFNANYSLISRGSDVYFVAKVGEI